MTMKVLHVITVVISALVICLVKQKNFWRRKLSWFVGFTHNVGKSFEVSWKSVQVSSRKSLFLIVVFSVQVLPTWIWGQILSYCFYKLTTPYSATYFATMAFCFGVSFKYNSCCWYMVPRDDELPKLMLASLVNAWLIGPQGSSGNWRLLEATMFIRINMWTWNISLSRRGRE